MFFTSRAEAVYYRNRQLIPHKVVKCRRWKWKDWRMEEGFWEHGYTVVLK